MERPLSAASSATTPSITSGPSHKRHASIKSGIKPIGPTVISLFVANLRLLNLDLLPDWPNITVSSFSNQDARTKIKCTEYALYQLFRLYDPGTTSDKLQPFFPPFEPLQSVNLRAALYRCLNELKKNGVLSKDVVLRKTMLDECHGDRFWEICLGFSAVVVRKCTLDKRNKHGRPIAEKLGTAKGVNKSERESMLPLSIAHRAALTRVLDEKQRKKETYARLYDLLVEKEVELRERKVKSEDQAKRVRTVRSDKLKTMEQAIEKSWVGSVELKDALINGDTCPKGDGMLLKPFDKLWRADGDTEQPESAGAEVGLLQSLNQKAVEQSARLRRWQHFHDHLIASKPAPVRSSRPASELQKARFRFDRHRNLTLSDIPEGEKSPPQQKHTRYRTVSRYDTILHTMREELRKNSAHRNHPYKTQQPTIQPLNRAQTQPVPIRRPNLALDVSPGATDPQARSPSQTAVPMRTPMGRRVASRSKSYQQPKVISQREPIPLKSELFSPLKDQRRSSSTATSLLPSPVEEAESPSIATVSGIDWATSGKEAERKPHDSGLGLDVIHLTKVDSSNSPTPISSSSEPTEDASTGASEFKLPMLPVNKANSADKLPTRPSLAERTRESIAFNSMEDLTGFLPDLPASAPTATGKPSDLPVNLRAISQDHADHPTTLLDRTRQSISLAPPPPRSKKPTHTSSRSSIHPINQFSRPSAGHRRSTTNGHEEDVVVGRREVTPIEKLLSPDAEYDSVFKARPRVAMSPVLSPRREVEGMDIGGEGRVGVELET